MEDFYPVDKQDTEGDGMRRGEVAARWTIYKPYKAIVDARVSESLPITRPEGQQKQPQKPHLQVTTQSCEDITMAGIPGMDMDSMLDGEGWTVV